jgi:quercetin 2,3-dioxygenase
MTQPQTTPAPGTGSLPGEPKPYFLEAGEGKRFALLGQMFTFLARNEETDGTLGINLTEGPAGPPIPVHYHEQIREFFYVIDGKVRVWLDDQKGNREVRLMHGGDFVWIPEMCIHAFQFEGHYSHMLAASMPGGFERLFETTAEPYAFTALAEPQPAPPREAWERAQSLHDVIYLYDYELF